MAGKRLQKPARRKKKRGAALLISRLIRLGMLAALLLGLWLAALGVSACADYFSQAAAASPAQNAALGGKSAPDGPEEPNLPTIQRIGGIVTVDPGHGGIDPGCGKEGALEKDIVLPISMKLKELLEAAGVTVVMTRQTDEAVSLDGRAIIANNAGSDLFVSVHCNSFEGEARGMDCYYHKSESANQLAQAILDRACQLGVTTRQVQKNNYQVLWDTDMPAVLVETGFLTDPEDCAALLTPAHQETVARAIAEAVLACLGAQPA